MEMEEEEVVESSDDEILDSSDEDEEEGDDDDDASSVDDEEIDELLDQSLLASKIKEYNEKQIIVLEEKTKYSLEVLPGGWIEVRHSSGMPLYLHRKTRVCTLAKPYFLGPASARRHSIPLSAIPCLAYRRQLDEEKNMKRKCPAMGDTTNKRFKGDNQSPSSPAINVVASGNSEVSLEGCIQSPDRQSLNVSQEETTSSPESIIQEEEQQPEIIAMDTSSSSPSTKNDKAKMDSAPKTSLPVAKVATAEENDSLNSISPEELRNYCKSVFKFKIVTCKRFKTWSARRKHTKEQKRIHLQRPTMPDGVKLISFPIHSNGPPDGGKVNKEYIMNPQGKSSVCILHEYVQHALRKQPSYIFRELENAATPYSATVVINGMQHGTGYGSSKKQAKADAAKTALEILIPQMKEQLNGTKPDSNADFDILPFFKPFELLDAGISKICKNFSEPPPYGLLLTCLQRNFGQDTCNSVKFEMISPGPQSNKFKMVVGEHTVEVQAPNKREGKQLASQHLLAKLHPNIKNFGSFVKLYGNNSIKSVKEKKQEEQQITTLQSKASANSPNWAILSKLKSEMSKLEDSPVTQPGLRPWPSNVKDINPIIRPKIIESPSSIKIETLGEIKTPDVQEKEENIVIAP